MAKTKGQFINELMETAQETIWKNELAKAYTEQYGDEKDKDVKIKACDHAIAKDKAYLEFLTHANSN